MAIDNATIVKRRPDFAALRAALSSLKHQRASLDGQITELENLLEPLALVTHIHHGVALHVDAIREDRWTTVQAVGCDQTRHADIFPDRRGGGGWQVRVGARSDDAHEEAPLLEPDGFSDHESAMTAAFDWVAGANHSI